MWYLFALVVMYLLIGLVVAALGTIRGKAVDDTSADAIKIRWVMALLWPCTTMFFFKKDLEWLYLPVIDPVGQLAKLILWAQTAA